MAEAAVRRRPGRRSARVQPDSPAIGDPAQRAAGAELRAYWGDLVPMLERLAAFDRARVACTERRLALLRQLLELPDGMLGQLGADVGCTC